VDLAIGFVLGFFALPWLWISALTLLFIVDVVLTETECFGWATFSLIGGVAMASWLEETSTSLPGPGITWPVSFNSWGSTSQLVGSGPS